MQKNKPILYDPMIIKHVKQYLEENVDQTFLEIGEMARYLKERHSQYRKRKMAPFRSLVHQAYRIVSQSYNLQTKESEQNSTSDVELTEIEPPPQPPNLLNNLMSDLYSRQSHPRLQVPINEPTAEPKRTIGIKGDESSGRTKRIGESIEGQSKRKRVKSPQKSPSTSQYPILRHSILCPEGKARITAAALIQNGKKKQKIVTKCLLHSQSTFDDVIGMDSTIKQLCKVLVYFKHREIFEKQKIQPPSGILLHGPAGCGKTFVAKCIAGHLGIPLMELSAVELLGGIGVAGEAKCRNIFDKAVNMQPCMIFIDDFDRAASNRTSAQRDGERRLVHQISNWMDEIRSNKLKILVVGATTQLDLIDPTLRKTGRFDNDVGIGILNRTGRLEILKHIAKKLNLGEDFPCERLAALTPGFVPADLNSLIGRSTLIALKRFWSKVTKEAFPKTPLEEEIVDLVEDSNSSEDSRSASPETLTEKSEKSTRDSEKDKKEHNTLGNRPCVNTDESGMSDQSKSINIMKDLTITEIETKEDHIYYTEELTERLPEFDSDDWQKMLFAEWKSLIKLGTFKITIDDFVEALKYVKPLSKKEGFITVPNVSWKDVGSLKVLRDELRLAVAAPVKYPDRLEMLGLTAPTGILLYGPPGCGKTLLAKAIANEAGVNFISVKGPELLSMYVGESERAVRLCFQRAKNSAPCVIFFDEFDALCPKRTHKPESSASGVRIVNQLLTEMDGVEERKDVFVLAATNRPDIIDPAVLRPGRLDKMLFVGLPNVDDRNDILLTLTKKGKKPLLDNSVDIHQLAEKTEGFTGADLAGLLREAAHATLLACMLSTEDQSDVLSIKREHFEKAFETVTPSVTAEDLKHYDKFKDSYLKRNACNQEC